MAAPSRGRRHRPQRAYRPGIGARAGFAGPVAFTAAWVISGLRQRDYSIRDEHISGLAAPDARNPGIMIGGFLALGGSMVLLAGDLRRRLAAGGRRPGPGPAMLAGSGFCVIAAGVLRRDRMANRLPGEAEPYRQSTVNDWHDRTSVAAQMLGAASTIALSRRVRSEPDLADLSRPMVGVTAFTTALHLFFASETARPGNGIVQRVGVTTSLAGTAAVARRLLRSGVSGDRPGDGLGGPACIA